MGMDMELFLSILNDASILEGLSHTRGS